MSENRSDSIGELAAALSLAQGEIVGAIKDSTNPFFNSTYADLASVWDAVRGPLTRNGLAVIQTTEIGEQVELVTTLAHKSGEWVRGSCPIFAKALDPQSVGSAITYARRYGLASIVGVAQIDDDGNAAQAGHSAVVGLKAKPVEFDANSPSDIRARLGLTNECDIKIKAGCKTKGLKYSEALVKGWASGQRDLGKLLEWLARQPDVPVEVSPLEGTPGEKLVLSMAAKDRLLFKAECDRLKRSPDVIASLFLEEGNEYSHDSIMKFAKEVVARSEALV